MKFRGATTISEADSAGIKPRTQELFDEHQASIYRQTDRIFLILMPLQWVAGIIFALVVSPKTWI
ncbi:MAG TPA: hypothetical protein VI756_09435, partial [Blastocatellia bacterium]